DDVFGESSIGVYADNLYILADVGFAGSALQTLAAGDVHFGGDKIAFLNAGDFIAEGDDLAAEFVSGDEGRMDAALGPAVPFVNVEIGAAYRGDFDFDQDLGASVGGDLNFTDFRARSGFWLDHGEHGSHGGARHGNL